MNTRQALYVGLLVASACSIAVARPNYGRNCRECHFGGPVLESAPDVINFDGFFDPDETLTGATDRGLLKVFTVSQGGTVDLDVLVDLENALGTRFSVELKRMEEPGVENGGVLVFGADPDWFLHTGSEIPDPTRPYYTVPDTGGLEFAAPQTFTFSMFVDETTPPDYYDLEFALAGQPGLHYNDEHFYLHVIPEPMALVLLAMGLAVRPRHCRRIRV